MKILVALILLILIGAMPAAPVKAHALDPGYLELTTAGPGTWRAYWSVPQVNGRPMPITAVLPDTCEQRRPPDLRADGTAFSAVWVVSCPGGLRGGEIRVEGLDRTQTDVLVRYELSAGKAESRRLTPVETAFIVPEPQGPMGVMATYGALGVEHILEGWDHLLFVFALLLLIPDRRRLIGAVTAFTAAHSLTLAAAVLGWMVVPGPPVEAVVALSIMFLAAELLRPGTREDRLSVRYPWIVAFGFGLLHGLGFAGALMDIGLPRDEVPLALLAFNLGIEAGQILFIAVVLSLAALLSRLSSRRIAAAWREGGPGMTTTGYVIGSTAAVWFVERVAGF